MPSAAGSLELTPTERQELEGFARSQRGRADVARRARAILMLADGTSYREIERALGWSSATTAKWKERFLARRTAGLWGRHQGSKPRVLTAALEARILNRTRRPPTDGTTHWSTRRLAKAMKLSHTMVARAWQRAGIQPHRLERYMRSTDPDFEAKAADVIGLYLHPPQHAAVFCLDEKSAIQALDRLDPVLPLSPGRAERHGFEYYRHGTLSLYAALNTGTGEVFGHTTPRHTSAEFVSFLTTLVASQPAGRDLHVILDNLSTHKTKQVQAFLALHPHVRLHFTPTYSSWLNQVELWFSKIERDIIARGIFTSVKDLARKIRRYIARYNQDAKPFRWSYSDATRRIA
jgi:transposase